MDCWWWNELFITTVPDVPTDQLLLASPGVFWQHILTNMDDDAPLSRHPYNPVTTFSIDSETCFTFMFMLNEQRWQLETETSETEVSDMRTHCPKATLAHSFFSSPQPTLFSPWINTASHWFTVCHYLLIAEHTKLASLRRAMKENLDSWVFGVSLILAAVMPST